MSDGSFQNDFFGDNSSEKRARRSPLFSRISEQRSLPHLRMPIEYTVIISVGVLVLLVIAYAAGMERGRSFSGGMSEEEHIRAEESVEVAAFAPEIPDDVEIETVDQAEYGVADMAESEVEEEEALRSQETVSGSGIAGSVYIVQLASFKSRSAAADAIEELRDKGFEADVTRSGDWYQVSATGYQTIGEARKAQERLGEEYIDCYIRKIK